MSWFQFLRGTRENAFGIGDGVNSDKSIEANIPGANKPVLRFNHTTSKWQYSNDGTTFSDLGSGLFEIDINGGLEPVTNSPPDNHYELDENGDVMPKT